MLFTNKRSVACALFNFRLLPVIATHDAKAHGSAPYTGEHARDGDQHAAHVTTEQGRVRDGSSRGTDASLVAT